MSEPCPDCGHPAAGHTHPDENIACTAIGCSCPRGDLAMAVSKPTTKAGRDLVDEYHGRMHEDGCECEGAFIRDRVLDIEEQARASAGAVPPAGEPFSDDNWSGTPEGRDLIRWLGHLWHNEGTVSREVAEAVRAAVPAIERAALAAAAPRVPDGDAVAALATATADALCFDGDECERMHEHLRNAASIVDALAAAGWALARTPEDRP